MHSRKIFILLTETTKTENIVHIPVETSSFDSSLESQKDPPSLNIQKTHFNAHSNGRNIKKSNLLFCVQRIKFGKMFGLHANLFKVRWHFGPFSSTIRIIHLKKKLKKNTTFTLSPLSYIHKKIF